MVYSPNTLDLELRAVTYVDKILKGAKPADLPVQQPTTFARLPPGRIECLPELAAELIRLRIDVLVAEATPANLAAKQAATTIPIVMLSVADPVRSKLITSVARPGGNVTGASLFPVLDVVPKVLELLKEMVPSASRIGVLWDSTNPAQLFTRDQVDVTGSALGFQFDRVAVANRARSH
jgi:ABC-type uncharacterized transport system substrate-binding protein